MTPFADIEASPATEWYREANYRKAAVALCERLGWTGEMLAGSTKSGYVFVFNEVQP